MDGISIADIDYLLFVIPGFALIWSYRYFTEAKVKMGELEYAAWSFIWGVALFSLTMTAVHFEKAPLPSTPITNIFSLLGGLMGIAIVQATVLALPVGYFAAFLSRQGVFKSIRRILIKIIS